ncbi:histidine phosphatase family protein [Patescibacteria group bacterium]
MINIIFETHSTTTDNEEHVSSGTYDVGLSETGTEQAKNLGERRKNDMFDAIYCSELQRSYLTAEIAFEGRDIPIIRDARLNELDYGDMTRYPSGEVHPARAEHITEPYPNGESYKQAADRMYKFLQELLAERDEQKILIIGHRQTQYSLEHYLRKVSLKEAITNPWTWQPGWDYELKELQPKEIYPIT